MSTPIGPTDPAELGAYWERLHERRGRVADEQIVCHPDAPAWLNREVDRTQRRAFGRALRHVGSVAGLRVLDVGCGTGRWSVRLRDLGATVTGVDLSETAIAGNRERFSGIEWVAGDITEVDLPTESFDLVVSVTVIQHLPPAGQETAIRLIADVLRPGGRAILLENIRDHGSHVFGLPIPAWTAMFSRCGLRTRSVEGYAYDLPLRAARRVGAWVRREGPVRNAEQVGPGERSATPLARDAVLRSAAWLSGLADPACVWLLSPSWATHVAFVLRKSG